MRMAGDVAMLENEITPGSESARKNVRRVAIHHHMTEDRPGMELPAFYWGRPAPARKKKLATAFQAALDVIGQRRSCPTVMGGA